MGKSVISLSFGIPGVHELNIEYSYAYTCA